MTLHDPFKRANAGAKRPRLGAGRPLDPLQGSAELFTDEAAVLLDVDRYAVLKAIARGRLPARRFGRTWVVTRDAVEVYDAERRNRGER